MGKSKKANPAVVFTCGHPATPENSSVSAGCLACDSGNEGPIDAARRLAIAERNRKQYEAERAARPAAPAPTATLHYGDCIAGMHEVLAPESVDLICTSIPFEELFTYSGKPEDVGNNGSTVDIRAGRFALNMRFVVEGMFRVLKPGCNACIHIQQLLAYKVQHGFMGRRDFRGAMVDVFTVGGELASHEIDADGTVLPFVLPPLNRRHEAFTFAGEFVIPKNPQQMAQRLNLHSLQFKTGYARDGNRLAPAPNDYVLIFHKPGEHPTGAPKPLFHNKANPGGFVETDEWVRDACGIWSDIIEIDVLDGARGHKEEKQEKHVCPLQLEVIRRLIRLYTNPISVQPDCLVLDPFMGIGSTAYVAVGGKSPVTKLAVEEPRNAVGFELKESYHKASLVYVERALRSRAAEKVSGPPAPGLSDQVEDAAA